MKKEVKKLKYLYQRMPKEKVGLSTLAKEVHKRTGFAVKDINDVIDSMGDIMQESMIAKKSFYLPKIGTLYPTIKPGKNVVNMHKFEDRPAELMYMPDRWVCRFKVKPSFAKMLLEKPPTKKEVNSIYRD